MEFYPKSVFHVYIVLSTVGFGCGSAVLKDNTHILKRYFCDENLKLGSFSEKQRITGENRQQQTRQIICPCRICNNFGWYEIPTFVLFGHFPVYPPWFCSALVWRHVWTHSCFRPTPSSLNFLRINSTNTFTQQLVLLHTPVTQPFPLQLKQVNQICLVDVLCRIRSKFSDVMINGTGLLCGIQPINVNNAVRVISNDGGIIPDAFECSTF